MGNTFPFTIVCKWMIQCSFIEDDQVLLTVNVCSVRLWRERLKCKPKWTCAMDVEAESATPMARVCAMAIGGTPKYCANYCSVKSFS